MTPKDLDPIIASSQALRESTFAFSDSLIKMKDHLVSKKEQPPQAMKDAATKAAAAMEDHADALKRAVKALA